MCRILSDSRPAISKVSKKWTETAKPAFLSVLTSLTKQHNCQLSENMIIFQTGLEIPSRMTYNRHGNAIAAGHRARPTPYAPVTSPSVKHNTQPPRNESPAPRPYYTHLPGRFQVGARSFRSEFSGGAELCLHTRRRFRVSGLSPKGGFSIFTRPAGTAGSRA